MKLLFLHIGKTGGTTVRRWLTQWYAGRPVYPVYDKSNSPDIQWTHDNFDAQQARACDLVMGHYDWSIRAHLPEHKTLVVIRHPLDRLVSQYKQYLGAGGLDGWNQSVMEYMHEIHSFDEFARHWAVLRKYRNYQARILSGLMWGSIAHDPRQVLYQINYLGIQSRLGDVLDWVADDLGVGRPAHYGRQNVGKHEIHVEPSTARFVEREHWLDCLLYRLAEDRLRVHAS